MNKKDKIINILDILFKCIYIAHLIFSFTCFGAGNHITLIITLILGGLLIIYRIFNFKKYIKTKGEKILIIFLISYIITCTIYYKYGIFDEIKVLIWMSLQFILLYAIDYNKSIDEIKKEIKYIFLIIVVCTTIINFINCSMLLKNYSSYYNALDGNIYILGIANWGRLYGITTDPNYMSIVSAVSIVIVIYLLKEAKGILVKGLLLISLTIQFIFISFAQSRTAIVSLVLGVIIYYILKFICKIKYNKKIKDIANSFIRIVIVLLIILFGTKILIYTFNNINKYKNEKMKNDSIQVIEEQIPNEIEDYSIEIKREDSINGDISNRRFDIWLSGYEIFKKAPIFGIGFGHFTEYAFKNVPSTYIINNDLAIFTAFHNTIIDVAVSQGIIGTIILIAFVYIVIKDIIKIFYVKDNDRELIIVLITICTIIGCSAMFLSHVFYVNAPTTAIFWSVLGYIMYFLEKKEIRNND